MMDWKNCFWRLCQMRFRCAHIHREEYQVAKALTSFGAETYAYYWWSTVPDFVASAHARAISFCSYYCFR